MGIRHAVEFSALLVLATSCKDGAMLDEFESLYRDQLSLQCMCAVEQGVYPDVATCESDAPGLYEDLDRSCAEEVFSNDRYSDWLDCQLAAQRDYLACLEQRGCEDDAPEFMCADGTGSIPGSWRCDGEADCSDGSDEMGCTDEDLSCEGRFLETCGDPPEGYGEDINACLAMFTCADGGEIPASWVCNGTEDCADGSDEASCGT